MQLGPVQPEASLGSFVVYASRKEMVLTLFPGAALIE